MNRKRRPFNEWDYRQMKADMLQDLPPTIGLAVLAYILLVLVFSA